MNFNHRFLKTIDDKIRKESYHTFFLYGDVRFLNDLFLYNKELIDIRQTIKRYLTDFHNVDKFIEIYYDNEYVIKFNFEIELETRIKDELSEKENITSKQDKQELYRYRDLDSFINHLQKINKIITQPPYKFEKLGIIFDDFEEISELTLNNDNYDKVIKNSYYRWKKIEKLFSFFIIKLRNIEETKLLKEIKEDAILIERPVIFEIAFVFSQVAYKYNKILLKPLTYASDYLSKNEKPLRNAKEDFENICKESKDRFISITDDERWTLEKVRLNKDTKDKIKRIFELFKKGKDVKGIILYGPPGTGKTTIAKALANEGDMEFLKFSSSDFKGQYVGESTQKTRRVFEEARSIKPCVLLIDEADAILINRNSRDADSFTKEIVDEFLPNVDGLKDEGGIFIVITTNNLDLLDPAIRSRFEEIEIPLPNKNERKLLIINYCKNKFNLTDKEIDELADLTSGLAGRDIKKLSEISKNKEDLFKDVGGIRLERLKEFYRNKIENPDKKFSDIIGYKTQKQRIINEFKKGRKKFVIYGIEGVGKTEFSKAFLGEINSIIITEIPSKDIINQSKPFIEGLELAIIMDINSMEELEIFKKYEEYIKDNFITVINTKEPEIYENLKKRGYIGIPLETDEEFIVEFLKHYNKEIDENLKNELIGLSIYEIKYKLGL